MHIMTDVSFPVWRTRRYVPLAGRGRRAERDRARRRAFLLLIERHAAHGYTVRAGA